MSDFFSFKLPEDFVTKYATMDSPFGFNDAGNNSLGEITFIRTYSRVKEDGTKERWHEVCKRVIEGMYSVQKNHAKENRLPWNDYKAQKSAQEAFDRMFNLKWTPPGRGMWAFGTPMTMEKRNSAALQNCAMVSTKDLDRNDPGALFAWVMDALMLGIGVGFDTVGQDKEFSIYSPSETDSIYEIPDTREGWVESVRLLLNSYLRTGQAKQKFNYELIRPFGSPIKGFGGVASGPEPLIKLHDQINKVIGGRIGEKLDARAIVDIVNLIGTCVVAGNVRRSATLALGSAGDKDFINLKNPEVFPERNSFDSNNPGWAWMSNNSISATVGTKYEDYVDLIVNNGEPGFIWLDVARNYGRLKDSADGKDYRVMGFNPCAEQPLESYELCTLVEVHLNRHENKEDFLRTLKFAYLYGKTVTLVPTHWQQTNGIMQRNRRIGTSLTGIASFSDKHGLPIVREWMDEGYLNIKKYDHQYSEWLCVRESIRVTTVKPSGSVSILSGATPGVHWGPGGKFFMRAIRFGDSDPMIHLFKAAGYKIEDDVVSANTKVVYFPIASEHERAEKDVSLFEKIALAATAQKYWSDNGVSVTLSFDKETESKFVAPALHMYEGQLKAVSFLPMGNTVYPQQPYTEITEQEYNSYVGQIAKINWDAIYDGVENLEAQGEAYCTTDVCEIKIG
ncbi:RTPR, ribonucleoside-triphosphate reductase, adenosylcobalamin-dependent [uncultured Caudovirales phage]|uniref:ribonucleoside-triphosphate reductase (thioredoxin) n=1 Tax=uncultured Caudovirales phage TaxID=2100421 RepID=A0A6J5P072_9CAUD|nr:RTPR, ribonucleoside-triphosphate reductase, adenosylcobalamin-dependent [uncultured Caudovirales phage]